MIASNEAGSESDRRREIILVGGGARARAWADVVQRASALSMVARVVRRPGSLGPPDVPVLSSLDAALDAFPRAGVASTLPPQSGLALAHRLASLGREGVVEAPLDDALADLELPPAATGVRVAHGLVTLSSVRWMAQALDRRTPERTVIDVRGLPEATDGDLEEVLVHGLALVLCFFVDARVVGATSTRDDAAEVDLRASTGASIRLRARAQGRGLEVRSTGAGVAFGLRAEEAHEVVWTAEGSAPRRERNLRSPAASVRALTDLLDPRGDDLFAAQRVARLSVVVRDALGRRPIPTTRAMRAAVTAPTALAPLERFGLLGGLPDVGAAPVTELPRTAEPLELWPFRAGRKPVAFITTHPADADRVVASFGDVHVERLVRRVEIGPQDTVDRRDQGTEAIELYLSRDPELARRAARLQAEGDPSGSLEELGRLMGYPACCIAAFAAQADRSNNVQNRYRTYSRTSVTGPWPWALDNLTTMVLPCFPCAYDCDAARELAEVTVAEMERVHAGITDALARVLGRPVLYFDQDEAITLAGRTEGDIVLYEGATVSRGASSDIAALAGVIREGDELSFSHERLRVRAAGRELLCLERTDPGLGFLAPFGLASAS